MKKKAVKLDKTSEHIPTCNRFSILESDEIPNDEDDETNIQTDSPSISPPKTNHKAKRAGRNKKKKKLDSQADEKHLETKANSLDDINLAQSEVVRCATCFITHFPFKRFCKQRLLSEFLNQKERIPEQKAKNSQEAKETIVPNLYLLQYCIHFLETKYNTCGCNCTCYEEEQEEGSDVNTESIRMRGGAGFSEMSTHTLITRAIESGKKHGINLAEGKLNKADGNCSFECFFLTNFYILH